MTAPFHISDGDTVNYFGTSGMESGYFVRWDKHGAAVIRKPAGGHVKRDPSALRPCNDGRMVRKRGFIEFTVVDPSAPKKAVKRGR